IAADSLDGLVSDAPRFVRPLAVQEIEELATHMQRVLQPASHVDRSRHPSSRSVDMREAAPVRPDFDADQAIRENVPTVDDDGIWRRGRQRRLRTWPCHGAGKADRPDEGRYAGSAV